MELGFAVLDLSQNACFVAKKKPATICISVECRVLLLLQKSRYNKNLRLRSNNHHVRGRVKGQLNAFLSFATDVKAQLRTQAAVSLKSSHRYLFTRRLDGTHTQSGCFGEERITALCLETQPRLLGHRSSVSALWKATNSNYSPGT
jgi:hypothetical protein